MRVQMIIDKRAIIYSGEQFADTRAEAIRKMPWAKVVKKVNNGWIGFESLAEYKDLVGRG